MKRVTVFFYKPLDLDSVLWRSLDKLRREHKDSFIIGGGMGVGAARLSWHKAHLFAAKIAVTVLRTESESVFDEMRLIVQNDMENTKFTLGEKS